MLSVVNRSLISAGKGADRVNSRAVLKPPVTAITLESPNIIRPAEAITKMVRRSLTAGSWAAGSAKGSSSLASRL
jgi:hypothetical protein